MGSALRQPWPAVRPSPVGGSLSAARRACVLGTAQVTPLPLHGSCNGPSARLNMLIYFFFWSPGGLAIVITIAIPVPSKHKRKTSRRFPSPGSMAALWFALR